jgi:hypothetical protein
MCVSFNRLIDIRLPKIVVQNINCLLEHDGLKEDNVWTG